MADAVWPPLPSRLADARHDLLQRMWLFAQQHKDTIFNPYITVARAERLLGVSNPTARQAVGLLQKHGVLKEISGRAWGKVYCAKPILDAVEKPAEGR